MDIYDLIHADHEAAKTILNELHLLPIAHSASRFALFMKLKEAVIAHNDAEAGSFYVALETHAATRKHAERSRKEHAEVAEMLSELSDASLPPAKWEQKFADFTKALMHHVEEEENVVFQDARQYISRPLADELARIMERLKIEKRELLRKAG